MALHTCSQHGVPASTRCPICHKPLCGRCETRDSCCSERCFQSRQKFGGGISRVERPSRSILGPLLKLAILGGLAYAAARHFGYL